VAPAGGNFPGSASSGQCVFFQAPAGKAKDASYEKLPGLLNLCGFYVDYGSDADWLPVSPISAASRDRYRLMFWLSNTDTDDVGTGKPGIFRPNGDMGDSTDWIKPSVSDTYPLADNIIALLIWPRDETASAALDSYSYDSRSGLGSVPQSLAANQLPPILELAMVAIDEPSAVRLGGQLRDTIESCMNGLFTQNPVANFTRDLSELEARLTANRINYRVFTSAVPLREAKWSPL
jgi:uncharacterized protein (TIGR02599 family)